MPNGFNNTLPGNVIKRYILSLVSLTKAVPLRSILMEPKWS